MIRSIVTFNVGPSEDQVFTLGPFRPRSRLVALHFLLNATGGDVAVEIGAFETRPRDSSEFSTNGDFPHSEPFEINSGGGVGGIGYEMLVFPLNILFSEGVRYLAFRVVTDDSGLFKGSCFAEYFLPSPETQSPGETFSRRSRRR